mmetsp:Transcript_22650/g.65920  ORF Transcript_22650/g.65920 Transcript_22650/m.65920 type:complete len:272 (+) Transcript_22650:1442-2257(+)
MLVHSASSQERRNRHAVWACKLVADDHCLHAFPFEISLDGCRGLGAEAVQSLDKFVGATAYGEGGVDGGGAPTPVGRVPEGLHLLEGQDRVADHQPLAVLGTRREEVCFWAHGAAQRHDHLLTDRVDGWVRDLGEELLEVLRRASWVVRQHGEGCVVAHGPEGLLAASGHGVQEHVHGLRGVAEEVQPPVRVRKVVLGGRWAHSFDPLPQIQESLLNPGLVGPLRGNGFFDLRVGDDLAGVKIHQEHFPGFEALLGADFRIRKVRQDTNLR